MSNFILQANTVTPRPPLNIFEASREILTGDDWVTLAEVPQYFIPGNGPNPSKTVNTVAIMTGLTITNIHDDTITASARIVGPNGEIYPVIEGSVIPPNDFLIISFDRQVMMTWEKLEVSIPSNTGNDAHACAHFSYIINQREEFNLISSNPRT